MQPAARDLFDAVGAGRTILVPNTELASALHDAVERMHLEAGHELWPTPRIRDYAGWLRECHGERLRLDSSLPRLLSDVEERELWRAVILDRASGIDFLEPAGAARGARRARRALFEYGIAIESLSRYPSEETTALIDWNRNFEERCRALQCIASDRLFEFLPARPQALGWLESPIWRPVARSWLQRNAGLALRPVAAREPAQARRLQAASPDVELAAIAEWARAGLRSTPDFRAWICVPDLAARRANVTDAFDAALAPRRYTLSAAETPAPYAIAGGIPLERQAPVRAALEVLAANEGTVSLESFSALLRSPELQPSAADAAAAAALDLTLRRRGPHEADLAGWIGLAESAARTRELGMVAAVSRLGMFKRAIDAAARRQPFSRWVSVWVGAWEAGPWAHRSRWSSAEFQAAERFRELLAALATADATFGTMTGPAAARILARAARDTAFQPQTGVPAIWVTGQILDPWLAYDGIWVCGCSEDRWPPPPDPIPLLPIRLQREHGVAAASADAQMQLALELQRGWRERAAANIFSCADRVEGRPAAFSPLLPAAPPAQDAALAQEAALSQEAAPATHPHWRTQAAAAPRLERLDDEAAPPFAAPERMRGIATLRAQSRCAFRGFAETRLLAEIPEKPVPGFNMRERGEMLHHALEYVWSALRTSARLEAMARAAAEPRDALARLVDQSAERAVVRQCRRRDPGRRWQRREIPRLSALIRKWLETERGREPFEIESLEHSVHSARYAGLEFDVRIDRIDRLSGGGRLLIDYKSGMAVQDWRGDRPDNPQLPVYAVLQPEELTAVAYARVNAGECTFVAEAGRAAIFNSRSRATTLEGMPDFAALVALWSQRIERIAREFAAGRAEVAPTPRACESCTLQPLCRIPAAFDDELHDD